MTSAFCCVLIAGLVPVAAFGIANHDRSGNDRAPGARLPGKGASKSAHMARI